MTAGAYFLGLDYGTKRIGVAVGQSLTGDARALTTISCSGGTPHWSDLDELISTWQPEGLVVGAPVNEDHAATPMSERSSEFGRQLSQRYNLPVHFVDERLTSHAANAELVERGASAQQRQHQRDQIAARLILQTFFNENMT